jgi:hypothetical protein
MCAMCNEEVLPETLEENKEQQNTPGISFY